MTSLTDSASNETDFTWTDNGQLHTQADPNGITQTRSYDADGRTTDIATANSSSTIADYGYGYDDDGELTSDSTVDPNNSTPLAHTYSYTPLTQLATVNDGTTTSSYTDTPAGEVTGNAAGSVLAYNTAQELTSLTPGSGPSTSYAYDNNGDRTSATVAATGTTSASTTSVTYDPAGDLASVGIPATGSTFAESIDYTSDGEGLRQSRTVGATTKDFLWDTNGSLPVLLADGTNSYLYGPSSAPIAEINDSTGTIHYLSDDLVGSTRLITTGSGAVAGVTIYNEYGTPTSQTGLVTSPMGYSGDWTDPDTGFIYLRARDYDPATAQFLSVDPLVDSTLQPYAYVANDPLNRADPSGCDWLSWTDPATAWLLNPDGGQYLTSEITGFGDGASFGITGLINQSDGGDCSIRKDGYYSGGQAVGGLSDIVAGAGLAQQARAGISVAGRLFAWANRAVPSGSQVFGLVPEGTTLAKWGALIWGTGEADATALTGTRTAEELSKIPGLTSEAATTLRDFYREAALAGKGLPTSIARSHLLDDIAKVLRSN
jgi:RHS repeat-associated protein